jgi:hypothetical protein
MVLLFSYTASSKLIDYEKFVFQMRLAPLPVMKNVAPVLGWVMPVAEAMIVFGLLYKPLRLNALKASVVLIVLFELYITTMLFSGRQLPCTCGGILSSMSWKEHLIFNAFFLFLGFLSIREELRKVPLWDNQYEEHKDLTRA